MNKLATIKPGGTIGGSMAVPDFSSNEGMCWNPECGHHLSYSSHATGARYDAESGHQVLIMEGGWATDCPYCGWTAEGAPKDNKWMKSRWPERYAELRARHFERLQVPAPTYWQRVFGSLVCDHDWVKTDAVWHEDIKELYWSHYRYQKATKCTGVICDKCGKRSIQRTNQGEIGTMHGLEGKPNYWYMAKNTQGPLNFTWPELPPYHFLDIPELINGKERTYEQAFGAQISAMEAGGGHATRYCPTL